MLNYNQKALYGFSALFFHLRVSSGSAYINIHINPFKMEMSTEHILSQVRPDLINSIRKFKIIPLIFFNTYKDSIESVSFLHP